MLKLILPHVVTVLLLSLSYVAGFPLEEHYGYITVRPGAHLFYVLYENDAPAGGLWTDYPVIMWLQGGPGSSGVGYGNFWELGPYDTSYTIRPGRWTQKANVLFVDQPVGTGYSYVENATLYTTTNAEIALDLLEFTKQLFDRIPDLSTMPFFVYAESYGGKMAVDYALELDQAIKDGDILADFQGVALGNSLISPMDAVNTWAPFLYSTAYVSDKERDAIQDAADLTQEAVDNENWVQATNLWGLVERAVLTETGGIDFCNIFATTEVYQFAKDDKENSDHMSESMRVLYGNHVLRYQDRNLDDFMNGVQKERWGISDNVTWGGQSGQVFLFLEGDFMKPAIDSVVQLLEGTNLHIAAYSGDWDLVCDTAGTYKWINEMQWSGKESFEAARRERMYVSSYDPQAGYVQRNGAFSLFTLLRSGHMAPIDQPELCLKMIDLITSYAAETRAKTETKEDLEEAKMNFRRAKMEKENEGLLREIAQLRAELEAQQKRKEADQKLKEAIGRDEAKVPKWTHKEH